MSLTTSLASATTSISQSLTTSWPTAVTTPYVFPPTCTSLFRLCSDVNGLNNDEFPFSNELLCVPTTGNTHPWAACQPTSTNAHVYSPAVCPSGWWALDVGMRRQPGRVNVTFTKTQGKSTFSGTYPGDGFVTISTAKCCSSGDSLGYDAWNFYPATHGKVGEHHRICVQTWHADIRGTAPTRSVERETSLANGWTYTTEAWPTGTAYYPEWSVEWAASDVSTLSPPWPPLSSNMLIPTWTEGMYVFPGVYDGEGDLPPSFVPMPPPPRDVEKGKKERSLKIYLPIGIVLLILLVIAYWLVFRIFKRNREAEERRRQGTWSPDQLQLEENVRRDQATGGTLDASGKRLGGGRWWRRKMEPEKREVLAVELPELEIPIR